MNIFEKFTNRDESIPEKTKSKDKNPSQVKTNYLNKINLKKKPKKIHIIFIAIVIILVGVIAFTNLATNNSESPVPVGNFIGNSINSIIGDRELTDEDIIKKVGTLTYIPDTEVPEVATVADPNQLNDQTFFVKAISGDKVLIYRESKRVILYRPSDHKIVETAPLVEPTPTPIGIGQVSIEIYNSTQTSGLADKTGEALEEKFENIEVANTANASGEYSKTLIIDISGNNKTVADGLAIELNGEVGELPTDETKPSADILIILGEAQ